MYEHIMTYIKCIAGRRSISAKHNIENNKTTNPPTITKSYTSSKKEELLKVINEAKQKLENVRKLFALKWKNRLAGWGGKTKVNADSLAIVKSNCSYLKVVLF